MRKFFYTVGALTVGISTSAHATLINFDNGQPNGTAIGSYYSASGVTFTNGEWDDNGGVAGSSGAQGLNSITGSYWVSPANPIKATFSVPVDTVSVRGLDIGAGGFLLRAYDSSNVLVDSQSVYGSGDDGSSPFFDLTVHGPIHSVSISQATFNSSDFSVYDNLSFSSNPVPEPCTLVGLGVGALTFLRRRRK